MAWNSYIVSKIEVHHAGVSDDAIEAVLRQYGIEGMRPHEQIVRELAEDKVLDTSQFSLVQHADVSFEVDGWREQAAALRRILHYEMPHYYLEASTDYRPEYSEPYMKPEHLSRLCIAQVPLTLSAGEWVDEVLYLDVSNTGDSIKRIYSGHIKALSGKSTKSLFSPMMQIGIVSPGKRVYICEIRVAPGQGVACTALIARSSQVPLDLEEVSRADTHSVAGSHRDRSGYLESSAVADPKRFRIRCVMRAATLNAEAEFMQILEAARAQIARRVRAVSSLASAVLASTSTAAAASTAATAGSIVDLTAKSGEKVKVTIANENEVLGELVTKSLFESFFGKGLTGVSYNTDGSDLVLKLSVDGDLRSACEMIVQSLE